MEEFILAPKSTMWAYDTSNGSAWQVAGVTSSDFGPGYHGMTMVVGDTIYFSNSEYGTTGNELWAHDTSNGSSWRVADINSGSGNSNPGRSCPYSLVTPSISALNVEAIAVPNYGHTIRPTTLHGLQVMLPRAVIGAILARSCIT